MGRPIVACAASVGATNGEGRRWSRWETERKVARSDMSSKRMCRKIIGRWRRWKGNAAVLQRRLQLARGCRVKCGGNMNWNRMQRRWMAQASANSLTNLPIKQICFLALVSLSESSFCLSVPFTHVYFKTKCMNCVDFLLARPKSWRRAAEKSPSPAG